MGVQLYIGNLSYRTEEKEVEEMFRKFGKLRYVSLKQGYGFVEFDEEQDADDAIHELHGKDLNGMPLRVEKAHGKGPKGPNREEGRGGGYRDYDDRDRRFGDRSYGRGYRDDRDRGDYYRSGGGRSYDDRRSGAYRRRSPPQTTAYRLTVKNLSTRVTWQELKDMMRDCGPVTCADAHNVERNVGRVYFVSHESLRRAMEKYQDMEINGRRIELVDDTIRCRSGSPSPYRRRSRSPPQRKRPRARSFSSSGGGRSAGNSHSPRSPPKRRRQVRRDDDSVTDHSSPRRADDRDKDREEHRADDRDKDREERRAESPRDEGRK